VLSSLADWVTDVIDKLGYAGVALLVALENLFPPIPSEIVLPFAGFVARDGRATLPGMILAATIGSLVGAWVLYGIAAAIGPDRFHRFIDRYGKWFRLTSADITKAERWFDKRAIVGVLVGRCIPLVRSLVSIPAGFRRMNFGTFTLYTAIGSLIWNTALIGAGYRLRENWHDVEPILDWFQYVVIAVILIAIGWFVWRRFLSPDARRRQRELTGAE
jgi:membrane protein DedA with SNARE-associated domain